VIEVIVETADTRTFVLKPSAGWPGHRAGQHVTVEIEIDGVRARRCYSLSSAPGDRHPAITVKRAPGGRVSAWLHDHARFGTVLGLGPAQGDFVLPPAPGKLLLLSGGSGVTPVMSMLRDLAARDRIRDVVFATFARTADDFIFRDALEQLASRHAGLALHLGRGHLTEERLVALVPTSRTERPSSAGRRASWKPSSRRSRVAAPATGCARALRRAAPSARRRGGARDARALRPRARVAGVGDAARRPRGGGRTSPERLPHGHLRLLQDAQALGHGRERPHRGDLVGCR
jgi:ferredoxin-NADP reductase